MEEIRKGDRVIYLGCSDEYFAWGTNEDPRIVLIEGGTYYTEKIEHHSDITKLHLRGIYGKFNLKYFKNYDHKNFY